MGNVFISSDMHVARRMFKNMRDRFMKIRKEYKPSGSGGGVPIEPTWPYYKQMLFLAPFMKHRTTRGNFTIIEKAPSQTEASEVTMIEEESCSNSRSEAFDIDTSSFEVEESSGTSYDSTCRKNLKRSGSSLETSTPPSSEKMGKKLKRTQDNTELLMEVVQNTNKFLSTAGKRSQPDEDDLFGQSVGKELKNLSPFKKSLAKMKIQQMLHEIRWGTIEK